MKWYYYSWISIFVILIDQATKLRIRFFLDVGESLPVIGDFFRITYITNPGAAFGFSFGSDQTNRIFFIVVSFIAIAGFIYLLSKEKSGLMKCVYALVIGGASGNLIDRIAYGEVIDFFDFKFFDFIMERWPVFNIADSAIVIAICLLILDLFYPLRKESKALHYKGVRTNVSNN